MAKAHNKHAREIWKEIPGYPGYKVSNLGRTKSPDRLVKGGAGYTGRSMYRFFEGKINRDGSNNMTYSAVSLGNRTQMRVHEAVMLAFVGPRPDGMFVCHNNSNYLDNRLENLRYGTPRSNSLDRVYAGTDNRGEKHPLHKLTEKDVREIRKRHRMMTQAKLAEKYGVTDSAIRSVLARRSWKWLK